MSRRDATQHRAGRGGSRPASAGLLALLGLPTVSTYHCHGCDATAMRLVMAALGMLIAHRVTRRRALLLPCCSQWTLTRDIPETLFVDCGRKRHVLNTSQARRWNYPSFLSLCFVLSQRLRHAEWGCHVLEALPRRARWRLRRRSGTASSCGLACMAEYSRVVPCYVCQDRPGRAESCLPDMQAPGRARRPRLVRHVVSVQYSNTVRIATTSLADVGLVPVAGSYLNAGRTWLARGWIFIR